MAEEKLRKDQFLTTVDGLPIKQTYSAEDVKPLEAPGAFPYTRNIMTQGYRSRLWTMRQYAGFATVEETNKRYKYLYEQGQTGFSVAFHLPTQIGYDSDHPLARGEVGRVGVAVDSLQDMEQLWDGIKLASVSTSMTVNATAPVILAMYIAAAEKQGAKASELEGTVQNDLLKEYIARNTYIFSPGPSLRMATDLCAYCATELPKWNSISISGYHMREAGSTAIQEVAFTMANGIAYVQAMIDRGMDVDSFAPRFSFFFASYTNLLEEVAKFRAARRVWAKIMKDRFHAKNPRSLMLRFHCQTDGFTLTEQQPRNNLMRVTLQVLAAVLGSCQSLHANSFDEALALPSEEAVQLSLRTQQIIAYESGVADAVDPLGGSYYVESLTDQIEAGVNKYLDSIDKMGGALEAIKKGYIQKEIMRSAYDYQKAVDSGEQVVVGVNKFQSKTKVAVESMSIDPGVEAKQVARLKALRAGRDNAAVKKALENVRKVAKTNENIMPALIAAVKTYATLGEITQVMREEFGEYREPNMI